MPTQCLVKILLLLIVWAPFTRSNPGRSIPVNDVFESCSSKSRGSFHNASIWGTGLKSAEILKRECFLINPMDVHGGPMDRQCSPPTTFWLAFLTSLDGSIKLKATIFHIPKNGFHQVCYKLMEVGTYIISVYLASTDYESALLSRNTSSNNFPYVKLVETSVEAKISDKKEYETFMASLPSCTQKILSEGENGGRWIDNLWHPYSCKVNRITPKELLQCLEGKSVLIAGDQQMRTFFAEFMNYLGFGDRCNYFAKHSENTQWTATVRSYKARINGSAPYIPGSEDIAAHNTEYGNGVMATYYGTARNGFGVGRAQLQPESNYYDKQHPMGSKQGVYITYVSHSDSNASLFLPWMTNYSRSGPLANELAPFDLVLASSGLHDLVMYDTANDYTENLDSEFVPSLRLVVREMKNVTWTGLWANQESKTRKNQSPVRTNARGFLFEATSRGISQSWGINWLGMKDMTSPREDLFTSYGLYAWPVSIATLELWLGSICPPSIGWEPDSLRC